MLSDPSGGRSEAPSVLDAAHRALSRATEQQDRARGHRAAASTLEAVDVAEQLLAAGCDVAAAAAWLRTEARGLDRLAAASRAAAIDLSTAAGQPFDVDVVNPVPF